MVRGHGLRRRRGGQRRLRGHRCRRASAHRHSALRCGGRALEGRRGRDGLDRRRGRASPRPRSGRRPFGPSVVGTGPRRSRGGDREAQRGPARPTRRARLGRDPLVAPRRDGLRRRRCAPARRLPTRRGRAFSGRQGTHDRDGHRRHLADERTADFRDAGHRADSPHGRFRVALRRDCARARLARANTWMATTRTRASSRGGHGVLRRPGVPRRERGEGRVDGRGDCARPRVGEAVPGPPRARERGDRVAAHRSISLAVLRICTVGTCDRRDRAVVTRPRRAPRPLLHAHPGSDRRGAGRGPGGMRPGHHPAQSGARSLRGASQSHCGAVRSHDDDRGPGGGPRLRGLSRSRSRHRRGREPSRVADRLGGSRLRRRALRVAAVALRPGRRPARRPLLGSARRGHERAPRGWLGTDSRRRRGARRGRRVAAAAAGPRLGRVDPAGSMEDRRVRRRAGGRGAPPCGSARSDRDRRRTARSSRACLPPGPLRHQGAAAHPHASPRGPRRRDPRGSRRG